MPTFERHALLACEGCSDVFVSWSGGTAACRTCGGASIHEIRWPPAPPTLVRDLPDAPVAPPLR
ncbi:MAG TPA: hypothetical protein VM582_09100 [Candidatus Thermoplasmatota archaeon]|nr:hypothetical protein [Candidatus Thermoplasmatota archaeon]